MIMVSGTPSSEQILVNLQEKQWSKTSDISIIFQIDQQKQELERLDQKMGKKRTEFQILQDSLEKKSTELTSVLWEAEAECASRQREAKVIIGEGS